MNRWREEIITKAYIDFGNLYDSFPYWLDEGEVGGYLDAKTPERYKKILFDFVDNLYNIYCRSIVEVFSYHDETIPTQRYDAERQERARSEEHTSELQSQR